jgi:hypothetical protein
MGRLVLAMIFTLSSFTAWSNERENQIDKVVRLSAEYTQLSNQLDEAKSDKNKRVIALGISAAVATGLGLLGYRLQTATGGGEYAGVSNAIGAWASYGGAVIAVSVAGNKGYRVFIKDPRIISKLSEDVKAKLAELEEAKKVELLIQEAN